MPARAPKKRQESANPFAELVEALMASRGAGVRPGDPGAFEQFMGSGAAGFMGGGALGTTQRLGMRLVLDEAIPAHGITQKVYRVLDREGNTVAHLDTSRQGADLVIENITATGESKLDQGLSVLREVLPELIADNPGVTALVGNRVSGARFGAARHATGKSPELGQDISIPIPPGLLRRAFGGKGKSGRGKNAPAPPQQTGPAPGSAAQQSLNRITAKALADALAKRQGKK